MGESGSETAYSGTTKRPRAIKNERVRPLPIKEGKPDDTIRLYPTRILCTFCLGNESCPTVRSKAKLMHYMRETRNHQQALPIFNSLIEGGHRPSLIAYTTLLVVLTIQKRFNFTHAIISQVKENAMEPDSFFYNAVINAFSRSGDMDEAIKAFWEMKASELETSTCTFNPLIEGYGNAGQHEESLYILELMRREGNVEPDFKTSSLVVRAWCSLNNITEAWNVVDKMVASGLQPNSVIYNTIVSAYVRNDDIKRAEGVISEMQSNNVHPDQRTCDSILRGYFGLGKTEDALRFVYKMKDLGLYPNVVVFNLLIKGFLDMDDRDSVDEVLTLMEEFGVKPDVITFSTIMNTWSTIGSMDKCKEIFDDMVKAGIEPDTHVYSILAKGYVYAGEPKKAEELLGPMIKSGICLNAVIFTTIINGWCSVGKMENAIHVFEQMQKHSISPLLRTFETLIWGFGVAKQPGKAKEVLQLMKEYNVQPVRNTFQILAEAIGKDLGLVHRIDTDYENYEKLVAQFPDENLLKIPSAVDNNQKVSTCATAKRSRVVLRDAEFTYKSLRGARNLDCRFGLGMPMVFWKLSRGHFFTNARIAHSSTVVFLS